MWAPGTFEAYLELYPNTPAVELPSMETTERFAQAWDWEDAFLDAAVRRAAADLEIVFVRGYLGNWMPGNLVGPARALADLGLQARILSNWTGRTVEHNVDVLRRQLKGDRSLLLCGHSKGGLECLALADAFPEVEARTRGVILSQTPRGASGVLESLLLRTHEASVPGVKRWAEEWTQRLGLYTIGAHRGGLQLTEGPLGELVQRLDASSRPYPVWQTASWSSQPTTWLDSFHGRLEEIRPGCAHDGQFFLEDLIWPGLPHVLLGHVDHAQPVMGGFGFDEARYWKVLIALFAGDATA